MTTINGAAGNDTLSGFDGNDTLTGASTYKWTEEITTITANPPPPLLPVPFAWLINLISPPTSKSTTTYVEHVEISNDYLDGGNGNDILIDHKGSDMLIGNGGDDTLYGGTKSTQGEAFNLAIAQILKLLTHLDRNPHSPTYGCFDRFKM